MAQIQSTPKSVGAEVNVTVSEKSTLTITSSTMDATAGDETSVAIPSGTKAFSIRAKSDSGVAAKLKIATTSGSTATDDHFDIMPGNTWKEDLLSGSAITLYMASTKASTVVQIMLWS